MNLISVLSFLRRRYNIEKNRKGIVSDIYCQYSYDSKNRLICKIHDFEKRIYDYEENDNLIYFKKVNNEYPDKNIEYSISIE